MGVVFWSVIFLGVTLWAGIHNCKAVVIHIGLNCAYKANLALWSRSRSFLRSRPYHEIYQNSNNGICHETPE